MKCHYSGKEIRKTEGVLYVKNSGERLHFASGKELKNWKKDRGHEYRSQEE